MKILKPLLLFISIYAAFVGCSKKSDPVAPVCHIATYTDVEGSYVTVDTYTYTNDKVASISRSYSTGDTRTDNCTYDSQGKITSITSVRSGSSGTTTDTQTLTYDGNNRLIQAISLSYKTVWTYNSSNQMTKKENYIKSGSTFTMDFSSTYTYPSTDTKNYSTQMQYNSSNVLQSTITYVYDTKQNPEALLFPASPEPTNNATKETFQSPGGSSSVVTFTYTYNDNGFPLTVIENNGGSTYTATYTYTNCK